MRRCCSDTLKHYGPTQPTEGLELACRWCESYLKYEAITPNFIGWVVHDRVGDFVKREGTPTATEARERAYARILGKERER